MEAKIQFLRMFHLILNETECVTVKIFGTPLHIILSWGIYSSTPTHQDTESPLKD